MTALHVAITQETEMARILLEAGAETDIQDYNGATVLHLLLVKDLINVELVEIILRYQVASVNIKDCRGNTPMHLISFRIDHFNQEFHTILPRIAQLLIEKGS